MAGKKILIDQPHRFRIAPFPGNLDWTIDVIQSETNQGRWGDPLLSLSQPVVNFFDRPSVEQFAASLQRAGKAMQSMKKYTGRPVT